MDCPTSTGFPRGEVDLQVALQDDPSQATSADGAAIDGGAAHSPGTVEVDISRATMYPAVEHKYPKFKRKRSGEGIPEPHGTRWVRETDFQRKGRKIKWLPLIDSSTNCLLEVLHHLSHR